MGFSKHSRVHIASLKREGVIVGREGAHFYRVSVGTLTLMCKESDLSLAAEAPSSRSSAQKRKEKKKQRRQEAHSTGLCHSTAAPMIDLHGLNIEEGIKRVETKIDRVLVAGGDQLDIMHGRGSGKLQKALHQFLSKLAVVKKYKISDSNPGVTSVYF